MKNRKWALDCRGYAVQGCVRRVVRRHPNAIAYATAVALLLTYSINEGAKAHFRGRENRATGAIRMFTLQQSMGNLDEFVSKWQEVNGLGNGKNSFPPRHSYLELKRAIDGLQMMVNQESYTMTALTDNTPGLPASAEAIVKSATVEVSDDNSMVTANLLHMLKNYIRRHGAGMTANGRKQYDANEFKIMRSEYFALTHTLMVLKLAEAKLLPQVYNLAAENGFLYQACNAASYFLYAIVVVIGFFRDIWGGENSRRNERGNGRAIEKMALVLGDINARLKNMEEK